MLSKQFLWFCLSGTLAFLVDAGIVQWLVVGLQIDPYLARLVSFLTAVLFTWLFNRSITFSGSARRSSSLFSEWLRYLGTQSLGGVVNYGVYSLMIFSIPLTRDWPVLGVAAGSVAGLLVNFFAARYWVFSSARR